MPALGQGCASAAAPPSPCTTVIDDDAPAPAKRHCPTPSSGQPSCDLPMYLMPVSALFGQANQGILGMSLSDLMHGDIEWCLCSSMALDVSWLLDTCQALRKARLVFVIDERPGHRGAGHSCDKCRRIETREALLSEFKHEEGGGEGGSQRRWRVHVPPGIACAFARHQSKFVLSKYGIGVRFIMLTANLQNHQLITQSQALFYQDFPRKQRSSCGSRSQNCSPFEASLAQYFKALELPEPEAEFVQDLIREHDFSAARVELITAVPGYCDSAAHGLRRLAALLNQKAWPERFAGSRLVAQASSIGSVTEGGWLEGQFIPALSAGFVSAAPAGEAGIAACSPELRLLGRGPLTVVWPFLTEVQGSLAGYYSGNQLRTDKTTFEDMKRTFLPYLQPWGGEETGRERAMPHTKIFCRVVVNEAGEKELAWLVLGSANFSKAAWGTEEKDGLKMLNFELSVLLTPQRELAYQLSPNRGFSCTSGHPPSGPLPGVDPTTPVRFKAWQWDDLQTISLREASSSSSGGDGDGGALVVPLPLPFSLERKVLSMDDCPWARPDIISPDKWAGKKVTDAEWMAWSQRQKGSFRWDHDCYGLPYGAYWKVGDEIKIDSTIEGRAGWLDVVRRVKEVWSGDDDAATAQQQRRRRAEVAAQQYRDWA